MTIRIQTAEVSVGATVTWTLSSASGHNGPWTFEVPTDVRGTWETVTCMFSNDYTLELSRVGAGAGWVGSVDIVSYVQDNTIYIPVDENWIVRTKTIFYSIFFIMIQRVSPELEGFNFEYSFMSQIVP